jgi:hypothetical protein
MNDISDLRHTIVPKSDQLNADQLLGGPMTITVAGVKLNDGEQPVTVAYEGDGGRPFKPCKTMRKLLIHAWGADGRAWAGRSMTVYNDEAVKFGGESVGGIRISHLSHIKPSEIKVALTATKGKKALYVVKRMVDGDQKHIDAIKAAGTIDALKDAFKLAFRSANKQPEREAIFKASYDRRMLELAPSALLQEYVAKVSAAINSDEAAALMDEARSALTAPEQAELNKVFAAKFGD